MKRLFIVICLIFSLLSHADMEAATATIKKTWLEHGLKINNRYVLKVHCKFSVKGMKGRKGSMCIWIKGPSGNWHRVNSQYKSSDGTPYFLRNFTPGYEDTNYEDYWYAPYIDDLCLLPGKNEYKVIVTITDDRGAHLAQSTEMSFNGTGNSAGGSDRNYNSGGNAASNSNGIVSSHREDLGYGGFVIVDKYANGYIVRTRYRLCPNCRGSQMCASCYGRGICALCNGQGGIISAGYGTYIPCQMCHQTGRCSLCGGTGRCACTQSINKYPGYVIGSTSTIAPDGTTTRDKADYGYGGGSSRSDSRSTAKKTCPDCGGTRLWQHGRSPEYAQPNSQLVGHYNPSGTKCQYCGHYEEHWHSKCATCKHYYGTENPYR